MSFFDTAAILLVLAATFGYVNERLLRLPLSIGLTLAALVASFGVLALDQLVPAWQLGAAARAAVQAIPFPDALLKGMLGFLLFAGALHIDLEDLREVKALILVLATVGVVISTTLVGVGSWLLFQLLGVDVAFAYCLVFGALIAPTDPIAVLAIMKSVGAPQRLETKVAGESLFNDGVGVIVFSVLLAAATGGDGHGDHGGGLSAGPLALFFLQEVGGGILLGLIAGYVVYRAMSSFEEPNLEILLSVALVMGMSLIAFRLHLSAPLACVVAGLFIGNHGRSFAMGEEVRHALDLVWSFLDEAMNAVLFLLVGLEVLALSFTGTRLVAAVLIVPLALAARWVSVGIPIGAMRLRREFTPGAVRVLTWGGLKGGISVALALSLPEFPGREAILYATYAVVVFSIVVQGLTVGRLIRSVA